MKRRLETIAVVAQAILNVSTQRAYEMARLGIIPVVRMGRQIRVDLDQLDRWLESGGSIKADQQTNKQDTLTKISAKEKRK